MRSRCSGSRTWSAARCMRVGGLLDVVRVHDQSLGQSRAAAPANRLRISTPCSSSRAATNSLHTRFMPSCRLVTTHTSAARYTARSPPHGSWCSCQQVDHRLVAGSRPKRCVDAFRVTLCDAQSWKACGTPQGRCGKVRPPACRLEVGPAILGVLFKQAAPPRAYAPGCPWCSRNGQRPPPAQCSGASPKALRARYSSAQSATAGPCGALVIIGSDGHSIEIG
jgi:hypothetical protein